LSVPDEGDAVSVGPASAWPDQAKATRSPSGDNAGGPSTPGYEANGSKDTSPYFHDNGAKTLRDAVAHYQRFFHFMEAQDPVGSRSLGGLILLTDDDVDDIVAYLKLLGPNRK
jgi:hypothetical protein